MEELVPWKILIPIGVFLVMIGGTMGMGGTIFFKHKEINKLEKEWKDKEEVYTKTQDSLDQVINERTLLFNTLMDSIIIIDEKTEKDIDSLSSLDFNDKIKHLSERFNIGS